MTTIELQQWRESFIERYLNKIDDMETVLKIEKYMKRIMSKANAASPISFSLKESNREIDIAEQELKASMRMICTNSLRHGETS